MFPCDMVVIWARLEELVEGSVVSNMPWVWECLREWWPIRVVDGRVRGEALRPGNVSRLGREKFWGLCRLEALPFECAVKPGNEGLVTSTGVCGLRTLEVGRLK
jgi:hypothetical protein